MQTLEEYSSKYKEESEEFKTLINGVLPDGWADELPTFTEKDKGIATRLHSQTMLNALAPILPGFWGGSAGMASPLSCRIVGLVAKGFRSCSVHVTSTEGCVCIVPSGSCHGELFWQPAYHKSVA